VKGKIRFFCTNLQTERIDERLFSCSTPEYRLKIREGGEGKEKGMFRERARASLERNVAVAKERTRKGKRDTLRAKKRERKT